ncbi:hypothetical protein Tco_0571146 [Tanacetum coccineum]
MMVQTSVDMGEDSAAPTDSHSTPIITQPSSSKPQKKKSRRKQRKDSGPTELITETTHQEHVSTPSCDPPQSGFLPWKREYFLKAAEIATLKERIKKLEKKRRSKIYKSKRLYKVGSSRRVESSEESLGAQEDAFNQGRKIAAIDQDTEVTLVNETEERNDEEMLFDVDDDLQGEEVVIEEVAEYEELAKGVVIEEPSETTTTKTITPAQPSSKDKASRVKKGVQKEESSQEEASRAAVIKELDKIQAMIEADEQLAARLQTKEQEQFSIEQKSRMLVQMIAERKRFFAAQRVAEQQKRWWKGSKKAKADTKQVSSTKRAGEELEQEKAYKQSIDEHVEEEKESEGLNQVKFNVEDNKELLLSYNIGSNSFNIIDEDDLDFFLKAVLELGDVVMSVFIKPTEKIVEVTPSKPLDIDLNIPLFHEPVTHEWMKNSLNYLPPTPHAPILDLKSITTSHHGVKFSTKTKFADKEACMYEIGVKCITEGYEYKVVRSCPQRYAVEYVHLDCYWYIFTHRIKKENRDVPRVYRPKDIINDLNIEFNIDVSYKRAWKGKQLALKSNQGDPISSFAQLPYYCYNLKLANENTVTHIDTDHEGPFKMLFIAFGAAVRI